MERQITRVILKKLYKWLEKYESFNKKEGESDWDQNWLQDNRGMISSKDEGKTFLG